MQKRLSPGLGQKKTSLDPKSRQDARQKYLSNLKGRTYWRQRQSPSKPQPARGGNSSSQSRANKQYSFKDEHFDSLFNLLNKSNRLKFTEARRPEEIGKTDNPNYCLYHRMLGHPGKSCFVFKDILQVLIDAEVLKLRPE